MGHPTAPPPKPAVLPVPGGSSSLRRNLLFFFSFSSGPSINLFRERLNDLEIALDARGRADDRHRGSDPVVAVRAEQIVVLDDRGGRQGDRPTARGVGPER